MKAAYLKAKYQFELRDVELREPDRNEVEVAVKACGFCGHDNILANYAATEWEPFGHEFAGVITKICSIEAYRGSFNIFSFNIEILLVCAKLSIFILLLVFCFVYTLIIHYL